MVASRSRLTPCNWDFLRGVLPAASLQATLEEWIVAGTAFIDNLELTLSVLASSNCAAASYNVPSSTLDTGA